MRNNEPDRVTTDWDEVLKRQNERRRDRAEPLRLGEDRLPARSLDSDPGLQSSLLAEPYAGLTIDARSFDRLGLSHIERRAVLLHIREGVVSYNLHRELGCSRAEALAALNRAMRKLSRNPAGIQFTALANSLRLTYRERLTGCAPIISLNKLGREFIHIMNAEKTYIVPYQRDARNRRYSLPSRIENLMPITFAQLQRKAADAHKNHDRICERLHSARVARDEIDAKLSRALEEFQREQADAILQDRAPDVGSLTKQIANLRTDLRAKEAEFKAATDAREMSAAAITTAQSDMESQRRAAVELVIAPLRDEYLRTQLIQAERAAELQGILMAHGFHGHDLIVERTDYTINFPGSAACQMYFSRLPIWRADLALAQVRLCWPTDWKKVA